MMVLDARAGRGALLVIGLLASACGSPNPGATVDAGTYRDSGPEFIAVQGDFADFRSWESFDGGETADDSLDGGYRTLYLNKRPPSGSKRFPLGTIIVKTTEGAETFAMVKRGADFNPYGVHWEWFELAAPRDGGVQVLWRGTGPAGTLGYGETKPTGCNECHLYSVRNDFVAGAPLDLSKF